MVDGLPPAYSFGFKHEFSILIWRVLDSGKLTLVIIFSPGNHVNNFWNDIANGPGNIKNDDNQ